MATAKISSVLPKERMLRERVDIFSSSFWDKDRDMSIYRILITKVVMPISRKEPPAKIRAVPANWPEEVRLVMEISTAAQTGSPPSTAIMPYANETERYPRQMGSPSRRPLRKVKAGPTVFAVTP